tara:strand:- start:10749 stop:11342 length:594 start_codon:yes stop_codon:yes gene_type:complete
MRRVALILMQFGVTGEMVAIVGMLFGILAGLSFMGTREPKLTELFWVLGTLFCLIRIACIRVDSYLSNFSTKQSVEEIFFTELPERVSDAVTIIGFGFAAHSSPWLGLACALTAIFSAYVRSIGFMRGAGKKKSASGPMTRVHRLILITTTSILMSLNIPGAALQTPIPQIALWVMLIGCLATILIRWFNIKEFDET